MGTSRRAIFGTLLATLGLLGAVGIAEALNPPVEARNSVDVPYDLDGPVAQPFEAYGLEGWLVRQPDESVRAFSAASTHLRCRVIFAEPGDRHYEYAQYEPRHKPGFFFDVCFNSTWTLTGERTFGPAPWGLDEFRVRDIRAGRAFLDLSRVKRGLCSKGIESTNQCSLPGRPRYGTPTTIDESITLKFALPLGIE